MERDSSPEISPEPVAPLKEGVIQYCLTLHLAHNIDCAGFAELNYWRSYLFRLGLIGQDPDRYGGLGFGNVSHRLSNDSPEFVISGSQTGHLSLLCREHYALVKQADVLHNCLSADGPLKPSSEALTHAAVYQAKQSVQCVLHVHSPNIWLNAYALGLMCTAESIPYGTPDMATAVKQAVCSHSSSTGVIAMLGHLDGIIAYSTDVDEAGEALVQLLNRIKQ